MSEAFAACKIELVCAASRAVIDNSLCLIGLRNVLSTCAITLMVGRARRRKPDLHTQVNLILRGTLEIPTSGLHTISNE